ncbi:MAG: ATP-binding cassette domain-containing protein [Gemmatimonadaceae bacterium]|nr:ATP-binding cassette domain-containing protein [Gemmatimonadaceae bacterium]
MSDRPDDRSDERRSHEPAPAREGTGFPVRRGADRERVRAAIRTELEGDEEALSQAETREYHAGDPSHHRVIALQNVHLAFDEPILEDVSFAAVEGETIVVAGESGTGKSTILKLLLRLLVPDRGNVYIDDEEITQLNFPDALKVRQKMGMVFQGAALFDSMTVFENIAYPLREHTALTEAEIEERVHEKLSFVDLDPDRVIDQLPSELSGGMRKRVGIARGMANNPEIMLYDEPTSGLDPLTTATITHLIIKLQRELGVTSIVVSHDIRSAFKMASKIAVLANRKIAFFGSPEELSGSDDKYLRDFLGGY